MDDEMSDLQRKVSQLESDRDELCRMLILLINHMELRGGWFVSLGQVRATAMEMLQPYR